MSRRPKIIRADKDARRDSGFSLIELMVALGIFSLLILIVAALSASAFRAIREATSRSEIQTQSQNAMEWASRLLRYADTPPGGTTAIEDASANGITVYTYSGTGDVDDAPYKARLFTRLTDEGDTDVLSEVIAPVEVDGEWTWAEPGRERRLLTMPAEVGSTPLQIEYFVCDPEDNCANPQPYVPTGSGPLLPVDSTLVPAYLVVRMGDSSVPNTLVTQTVKLVNLS